MVKLVIGEPARGERDVRVGRRGRTRQQGDAIRDALLSRALPSIDAKSVADIDYLE